MSKLDSLQRDQTYSKVSPKPLPLQARSSSQSIRECPNIPVRMLNEFVYCPRLAYLEWVQKEWADSADTVEGKYVHRRVDRKASERVDHEPDSDDVRSIRSLDLSSDELHLVAKIDLLELRPDGTVVPVEYKRGKRPHTARQAYDPERVQLCAQALLLEANGYRVEEGVLYFAGSRERVRVWFDEELRSLTLESIDRLREVVERHQIPEPLENSPKCPRCSLVGICLPDEVHLLNSSEVTVRPLAVRHTHALPVYIQANGAKVAKEGERLAITKKDEVEKTYVRLGEVSQLAVFGNVYVTTPTLHELMRRQIPITWHSHGGWFLGHSAGVGHGNVEARIAQYKASFDELECLKIAKGLVRSKIRNCRVMLRRNLSEDLDTKPVLQQLRSLSDQVLRTQDLQTLLGVEGAAASCYFQSFSNLIGSRENEHVEFNMECRNRRPPTDPINALLSFGYAMLTRTLHVTISGVGLDPYTGFYHQPRYGRPALALDLMEPFRPLIVDSVVVTAINNGEVNPSHFIRTPVGVNLTNVGRKKFIASFERRLDQSVTHPIFGYKIEYRRLFEVQIRLLCRYLLGEIPEYPNFETR